MPRVLVSWIGRHDLEGAEGKGTGPGPLANLLGHREFDRIELLSNYADSRLHRTYVAWLKRRTATPIEVTCRHLKDPTDHAAIYDFVEPVLSKVSADGYNTLTVLLSSGTPAMHAVWLLLCKTRFPAELLQTSLEEGVTPANVPFDIYAELSERLAHEALARPAATAAFADIIHESRAMSDVIGMAARVAQWPVDVLIEGESGTGKELFAHAIHNASPRKAGPFVTVNCGAIPANLVESELFGHMKGAFSGADRTRQGRFMEASGGTLFLDELGELPKDAQVKLLRAVEYREVTPVGADKPQKADVRIIAATNRDLLAEIDARRFREDLYYRLSTAVLTLPPLRARKHDVALLVSHALAKANDQGSKIPGYEQKNLSPFARKLLREHPWPGNVRELMGTVRRAAIWSEGTTITVEDARKALAQRNSSSTDGVLHRPLSEGLKLRDILAEVARHYIERALEESAGVKKDAADLLGLGSYQTLTNWMAKYGVDEP